MPVTATGTLPAGAATADDAPLRVSVIIGSVREGRQGAAVAEWFLDAARRTAGTGTGTDLGPGLDLDVVDLTEVPLPMVMPAFGGTPDPAAVAALADVTPRMSAADAFVVITPEYNHSVPAALKNFIDWHHAQWHAKPVGFVSYGGLGGGLRAVEHLRQVFAELHATTVRDSVSLHGPWSGLGADGTPRDTAVPAGAVQGMLGQLTWWGRALRAARARSPYRPAQG